VPRGTLAGGHAAAALISQAGFFYESSTWESCVRGTPIRRFLSALRFDDALAVPLPL
jgi:hypothetical protein